MLESLFAAQLICCWVAARLTLELFPVEGLVVDLSSPGLAIYFCTHNDTAISNVLDIDPPRALRVQKYLAYAKTYVKPRLSEEASQSLIHAYVNMRKVGSGSGQVTAYPRQLESLIRCGLYVRLVSPVSCCILKRHGGGSVDIYHRLCEFVYTSKLIRSMYYWHWCVYPNELTLP